MCNRVCIYIYICKDNEKGIGRSLKKTDRKLKVPISSVDDSYHNQDWGEYNDTSCTEKCIIIRIW